MALHVERIGRGADLVLLHGWGLHGGVWRSLVPRLEARFRLHLVDLPGHGHSRDVAFGDLDALADAVAEVMPESALVCGWSLGGLVAMRLATRQPRLASRLALVSATPCFAQRPDWPHAMARETLEQFAAGLHAEPARTIRTFVNLNALGGPHARESVRALAAMLAERGTPSEASLQAGLALLHDTDLRDEVGSIDRPCVRRPWRPRRAHACGRRPLARGGAALRALPRDPGGRAPALREPPGGRGPGTRGAAWMSRRSP
ncbi:MAG: alpha/beta fold hydrolase [Burkholderiales bacterium]|nr:alpha/beta fold hydrolase [Burkholderiales bacterium]